MRIEIRELRSAREIIISKRRSCKKSQALKSASTDEMGRPAKKEEHRQDSTNTMPTWN